MSLNIRLSSIMVKKSILFVFFLLTGVGISLAQEITIKGSIVNSEDNLPIIGANVVVKGTTIGTITDGDGKYELSVPESATIVVSYIGMISKEINVRNETTIDVTLEQNRIQLDEVVAIGYGSQRRSDITGTVSTVSSEEVSNIATSNVEMALQGRASGINLVATDGNPGASMHVVIRGLQTIGNNDPLYIVDGVEMSSYKTINAENEPGTFRHGDEWPIAHKRVSGLDNLNPNDIESIEILKDASAAAIYGVRAANGVVLVTTKRGKKGKPQVAFDAYWGNKSIHSLPEVLNTKDFVDYINDSWETNLLFQNDLTRPPAFDAYLEDPSKFPEGEDWLNARYNKGLTKNYNLRFSGGNEFVTYMMSTSSYDEQGVIPGTYYDRVTIRSNTEIDLKRLKIGQNISLSRSHTAMELFAWSRPALYYMSLMPPWIPVHADAMDENEKWIESEGATGHTGVTPYYSRFKEPVNSLVWQELHQDNDENDNVAGNIYAELEILEDLKYKIDGKVSINNYTRKAFTPTYEVAELVNPIAGLWVQNFKNESYTLDQLLSYSKEIGDHKFSALAGFIMQRWDYTSLHGGNSGFLNNDMPYLDAPLDARLSTPDINGGANTYTMHSYLGRFTYNLKDKYLITANIRRDGSSKFREEFRWGNFPGISGKWRVSKESFWMNVPFINEFSVSASYGKLGRDANIGPYSTVPGLDFTGYTFGGLSAGQGVTHTGATVTNIVNTALIWEEAIQQDYGIELGLLKNKLWLDANYYHAYTKGMLLALPIPSTAPGGEILDNAGEILNRGLELELSFRQTISKFNFNITGTFTRNINEVLDIGEGNILDDLAEPIWDTESTQRVQAGGSFGDWYLIETDGIFQTPEEVQAHSIGDVLIQPNASPGDIRYVDSNGDSTITAEDRIYMGSAFPIFEAGLNVSMSYRNFDLTVFLYANYGNKVYNGTRYMLEGMTGFWNQGVGVLDRWTETNPTNDMPRAVWNDPNNNTRAATDRFLEDGSFLKLKQLELAYNLPKKWTTKIGMSNCRIYVSGQNLLTFTKYSGLDPEVGRDGIYTRGMDRGITPQLRTFIIGIHIGI